jgi:thiol-disulfide isomerase/thioredoxin
LEAQAEVTGVEQLVLKMPGISIGSPAGSIPPEVATGALAASFSRLPGFYKLGLEDRRRVLEVAAGLSREDLLVDIWASWCAPCMGGGSRQVPRTGRAHDDDEEQLY